ncbi:hypothetical protein K2173_003371 [Erythroxylum novogranatense]|uniref:Uncharacterized protein n=1 Tax=Erythroxylum novogranatense TaxID=1862640 RepID=A0AAV8S8V7_9ROSI|nr:hypothetical protein K2173_003371 [Erythroxylum novogranatense]
MLGAKYVDSKRIMLMDQDQPSFLKRLGRHSNLKTIAFKTLILRLEICFSSTFSPFAATKNPRVSIGDLSF